MAEVALYILDEDKRAARARVAELEQAIQDLGPEFYDVFNQSSETWHDNAPFDALRDRQSVLAAELQSVKAVLKNAALSIPKQKKNVVGIGTHVVIRELVSEKDTAYFIAGDWTARVGEVTDGAIIVSAQAPLAKVLMHKKVGDQVQFKKQFIIQDIKATV